MSIVWAILLLLVLAAGWLLTVLGMPGNWLMVVAVVVYVLLVPAESATGVGWPIAVAMAVLAGLGELLEFLAGALGVAKAGGSKRGAALALVGSIGGGVLGLSVGTLIPVPVLGSLIGAVLIAGAGAFAGAVLGEKWKGRQMAESVEIGKAAFWGRLLGTAAKAAVGAVMVGTTLVALLV